MCENLYKKLYMTPETFAYAVADAVKHTYYRDGDWLKKAHPEDLSSNFIVVTEAIGAFLTSLLDQESMADTVNSPRYAEMWTNIQTKLDELKREDIDYTQANDAYFDDEADGNDAS